MKSLGLIRKMYATIEWCPANYNDPPGTSRFAGLNAWCSVVSLWQTTISYGATNHSFTAFSAVVGLKERDWDNGVGI